MAFINPSMTNCPKCVKKVSKQPNRIDAVSKFDMAVFQALLLKLETCVFNEKLRKEFKLWKPVKEEVPTKPMQIFKDHSPVQVFGYLYHYPELAHLRDEQGCQPIHWAASLGRYQVCLLLVRFGAKLDYQDLSGDVALHKAVQFGHLDIAQMLYYMLPRAATIQNSNGQTPFQVAIEKGHQSIAEFLSSKSIKRNY
jgi:hypothetical protein